MTITKDGINKLKKLFNPLPNFDLGDPPTKGRVGIVMDNIKTIPGELGNHASVELRKGVDKEKVHYSRYLLAEVLELAGNIAVDNSTKKISAKFVSDAIKNDDELNEFFSE